jgi:hypothetical protein
MDMPGPEIPTQPSIVRTDGTRLRVLKRRYNGNLDIPRPHIIKGVAWSLNGIGMPADNASRRAEFKKWYIAGIQRMMEMGVNTVYCFLDFGAAAEAFEVLDNLYEEHFEPGTLNL